MKAVSRCLAFALAASATFCVAGGGRSMAAVSAAQSPFFMFSTSKAGDDALAVVSRHARAQDYVSSGVAAAAPALQRTIPPSNVYVLPASVAGAERSCGSGVGLVLYDGEHWDATPPGERADMAAAIARGRTAVKRASCRYGVGPDGEFAGLEPKACAYSLERALHRNVDWRDIDLFDIQAQRLLSTKCQSQNGLAQYVAFVSAVAGEVRARNPNTLIVAQMSLRYTAPEVMADAIRRLRGVADGFYIAYPSQAGSCRFCTPGDLGTVLQAIRPAE